MTFEEAINELDELNTNIIDEALTPEQKVDMWHDGSRGRNIHAMNASSLLRDYKIAKQKDYDDLCKLMADEVDDKTFMDYRVKGKVHAQPLECVTGTAFTNDEAQKLYDEIYTDYYDKKIKEKEEARKREEEQKRAEEEAARKESEIRTKVAEVVCRSGQMFLQGSGHNYNTKWHKGNGTGVREPEYYFRKIYSDSYKDSLIARKFTFHGGYSSIDRYYGIDLKSKTEYHLVDDFQSYVSDNCTASYYVVSLTPNNKKIIQTKVLELLPNIDLDTLLAAVPELR